ncbi:MAG: CopG family ribbon-helix-helix protein [Stellaceae bacterium]
MAKTEPISIRLPETLSAEVNVIAASLDRSKSWVIEQAVREFVNLHHWQLAAIDEGLKAADEGRVVAHEDVAAWVRSWGGPNEQPKPKCE